MPEIDAVYGRDTRRPQVSSIEEAGRGPDGGEPLPIDGILIPASTVRLNPLPSAPQFDRVAIVSALQPHEATHAEMHMPKGGGASGTPWDDQVAHLMSREGMARDRARDQVILEFLKRGDSSALAALLIDGHVPSPNVRFSLALMLLDNEAAEAAIARHHIDPDLLWLPHRFVIKSRPAKPRRSHGAERAAGDGRAERNSSPMISDLGYAAALARLDQAVLAADAAGGRPSVAAGKAAAAASKPSPRQQAPRPKRKR
jgi:hypothetical protein